MEERNASAGDVRGLNQSVYARVDLRRRKFASIKASDHGLLRGSHSCKRHDDESWDIQGSMQGADLLES
jgi:hypothetical protein